MHLAIFLIFLIIKSAKLQTCGKNDPEECGISSESTSFHWSAEWSQYDQLIEDAAKRHIECGHYQNGCSKCYDENIKKDLLPFQSGISREGLEKAANISRITKYQIIDGELFRSESCMFPFRCSGIEHFLLELIEELPNTEFYLNTRDWPMAGRYFGDPVPVFSFSKTSEFWDIMFPAWTFWEGGPALGIYPVGLGRWDEHISRLTAAAANHPWPTKLSKGFFRGSRTSAERDPLILLSRENNELVDAKYTKNQAWKSSKDTLGELPAEEVKLEDH
jgi:protein glucosyltransferase